MFIYRSAKSVKIGLMEVGEGLARRGHRVTVVSPHKYKKVPQGVTDVIIPSEFDQWTTEVTLEFLTNPNAQLPLTGVSEYRLYSLIHRHVSNRRWK